VFYLTTGPRRVKQNALSTTLSHSDNKYSARVLGACALSMLSFSASLSTRGLYSRLRVEEQTLPIDHTNNLVRIGVRYMKRHIVICIMQIL
jgi:hypothetical protein